MKHLSAFAIALLAIDLQVFAIGTTVEANPGAPRRNGSRDAIGWPIDLTVTPAAGSKSGQAGGIMANEMVYKTAANGLAGLTTTGTTNANAASMVGVSAGEYPPLYSDGIFAPDPGSSPTGATPYLEVYEEGDFLFNATAAQTINPLVTLYLGADGRTVSTVASGTKVGYASPDQRGIGGAGIGGYTVIPPSFPITTVAGQQIYTRITPALTNANG
jgi:hypothetical protein